MRQIKLIDIRRSESVEHDELISLNQSQEEDKGAAFSCIVPFLFVIAMIVHWVIFGY